LTAGIKSLLEIGGRLVRFKQWYKVTHDSYIDTVDVIEDYEDQVPHWKIEKLLHEAYEAGRDKRYMSLTIKGV
jgi:hypothetical protein